MPEKKIIPNLMMGEKFRGSHLKSIWRTCNKIRAALFQVKHNLRDDFLLLDPTKSGLVSESKFLSVFQGKLQKLVGLSEAEIIELTDYFKTRDGRIYYRQFCEVIQDPEKENLNPGTKDYVTGLEWEDPLHKNSISSSEHRHLCLILAKIAQSIRLRDVVLRPYFQDYELISNNHGTVTFAHFNRVLHFLDINLSAKDFQLLLKRYMKDSYTINYVAFLEDIEANVRYFDSHRLMDHSQDLIRNFPGKLIDVQLPKLARPEIGNVNIGKVLDRVTTLHPVVTSKFSEGNRKRMEVDEILLRIQRHVFENQVRVKEFFEKFDIFRCGFITKSQFIRGLDAIGVSTLRRLYMTSDEIEDLCQLFADPDDAQRIAWRTFVNYIDKVFNVENLQCNPNTIVEVPPKEVKQLEKLGAMKQDECQSREFWELCQEAVFKINQSVTRRMILIEPLFRDFDRHRLGHVSINQFHQVLSSIGALLTSKEIQSLERRYLDDMGFNYILFLRDIEPQATSLPKYIAYTEKKIQLNSAQKPVKAQPRDIIHIIADIKAQAVRKRINISQFMAGNDPLKHETITCSEFKRGLQNANIILNDQDLDRVCEVFKTFTMPNHIDYKRFCDLIEEAFTQKGLTHNPLTVPLQHFPSDDGPDNFLNFDERCLVSLTLQKLSKHFDTISNLSELFTDYDKTNCGTITQHQLLRALSTRDLHNLISSRELNVLFKCFAKNRGLRQEFKYKEFLQALKFVANAGIRVPF
uniref:CSON008072 protein n=1 Tax=Culicoides sonorensis TaxID=179676 RepID=A0A336LCA6_CULSO